MRIGAGQFKGRRLLGPAGRETRPITALLKKSLFDMLADRLDGAVVADIYCGTGTLGLEAFSRGARRCCFAERNRTALGRLRRNLETLQLAERATIFAGDIPSRLAGWLGRRDEPINIAFVDPPFADARRWDWDQATAQLFTPLAEALAERGLLVLRIPAKVDAPQRLGPLQRTRCRRYGGMQLLWFQRPDESL